MQRKHVGIRLPLELYNAIKSRQVEGETFSDVVIALLNDALNDVEHRTTPDLSDVEQRLNDVEHRLSLLEAPKREPSHRPRAAATAAAGEPNGHQGTISDSVMRRRWKRSGVDMALLDWAASQGYRKDGAGNRAVWIPRAADGKLS